LSDLLSWLLYEDKFSPAILSTCCVTASYGIAAVAPFSHRLAFDDLPADLQRLRCKVNFQALVFRSHIISLGETLVKRLRSSVGGRSSKSIHQVVGDTNQAQKYAVLHLRFDKVDDNFCSIGWCLCIFLLLKEYLFQNIANLPILFRIWLHILPVTLEVAELNS
jgi:hypothetical protein